MAPTTRPAPPAPHRCGILPPYLLRRLAQDDDPAVRDAARASLAADQAVRGLREERAERIASPGGMVGGIVAPGLLDTRRRRATHPSTQPSTHPGPPQAEAEPRISVHDAEHGESLPGRLALGDGAPADAHPDVAAREARDGLAATWTLYERAYERDSLDDHGLPLVASVHYGDRYDNAFWDGQQMVFGDGDGVLFQRFTRCVDVVGHELTHGFTQFTAGLVYVGQSGALNESVSDVFGVLVKQHALGQTAAEADWLVGKGLFTSSVHGVALRSMKAPGTAYDDPRLGRDPQPATMDDYDDMPHDADHDNGGVHVNSGIPNRAFYLAATAIGGHAWEGAGACWYDVMTGSLPKDADFATFARATVAAAEKRFGAGSDQAQAVGDAWVQVKVLDA